MVVVGIVEGPSPCWIIESRRMASARIVKVEDARR